MTSQGGHPPRSTSERLPPASPRDPGKYRRQKMHQTKEKDRTDRRNKPQLRERTASIGNTRGAFGHHPDAEAQPPVEQVNGYSPGRSNIMCHRNNRQSSSNSQLNGIKIMSVNSNDAMSSCLDQTIFDGQSQNHASLASKTFHERSIFNDNANKTFDDGLTNRSYDYSSVELDNSECGIMHYYYKKIRNHYIYDPECPEFTTLQQSFWAVFIGVIMGIITALWGGIIELCVECIWKTVPEYLYEAGVFTDLDGHLPLPHYMWICPALFGGVLSYISAIYPIPGQNEWIESLHYRGVMDHSTLIHILLISTGGMASGLSLGPELPLVLTAGMVGSFFGTKFHQSMLSARVMNLTAASAAIAGFFGFPMAGALFVLELPHRMGLQYFEALSPAILASIFAVLVNRILTGDEVKGYFEYPELNETLPSYMFGVAFVYAFIGLSVGIVYTKGCLFLKKWVHDWFYEHPHDDQEYFYDLEKNVPYAAENAPLLNKSATKVIQGEWNEKKLSKRPRFCDTLGYFGISDKPTRAAVAGTLAGMLVGVVCMFVPHSLFWGEAQLQTLIDRGKTPLPVFGTGDEPTALLTAYGYCINDADDDIAPEVFGTACAGIITITKIVAIGLSLGTGIIGGHFWGPLYVGCAASHFFLDIWSIFSAMIGFGSQISEYPCGAMLCIMGSAHVVIFRANIAIVLILSLSIQSFLANMSNGVSSNYSAIFSLLVVSCFISLQGTKKTVFYSHQRCRGDIKPIAKVLRSVHKGGSEYEDGSEYDDLTIYDDDDLRIKSTEDIIQSYDRSTDSQLSFENNSAFENDLSYADKDNETSDAISYDDYQENGSCMSSLEVDRATDTEERYSAGAPYENNLQDRPTSNAEVGTVKKESETPQNEHTQQQIRSPGTIPHPDNSTNATAYLTMSDAATAISTCVPNYDTATATSACLSFTKPEPMRRNCSDASYSSARSSGKIEKLTASLLVQGRCSRSRSISSRRQSFEVRSRSNAPVVRVV